ncbi:MAG: hypothetical protein A2W93_10695 [Bacteroidetes bacterium GWF2_43_63]|nr:MAG: hypothetical protein A2W94_01770 [Bacteroidetes bacterium GWE2_42_42]OFY52983.1 MAG: hypothetical protein A2W93_10695 [Bacteroidetes bacterium GWF2_43_63]HBG70197.1 hypothetical protein [Bacteroidales bacterium]HCB62195.1 hypothetical protein [Bacteroidales bacterium]
MWTFNPSDYITLWDWLLSFMYMGMAMMVFWVYIRFRKNDDPAYRWFIPALFFKFLGGIAVLMIYAYYYTAGGDTYSYFDNTKVLIRLSGDDFSSAFQFLLGDNSWESYSKFTFESGRPWTDLYADDNAWAVSRFTYPIVILGLGRIMTSTILFNVFAFIGPWKLFKFLNQRYPGQTARLAFAIFFIPSCVFWGSGLYKDSFTLSATLWILYSIMAISFEKKKIALNIFLILVNSYLIISIKPYIFVALMPAALILFLYSSVQNIRNKALRVLVLPLGTAILLVGGLSAYSYLSPSLGKYGSMDSMMEKLVVTREDFINNKTYSSNFFDIGDFDPTMGGLARKAPLAFIYGLFGPFPWQVANPVMAISSLEGMLFLVLFVIALRNVLFRKGASRVLSDPVIIGFLIFSLMFIIFVGLSTANFGSLVRYRIPALPLFFFCVMYIIGKTRRDQLE